MNLRKPNYKLWLVDECDFPKDAPLQEKIKFIVQYGFLAPSVHNTQPWKISIKPNFLEIKPDFNRQLNVADPSNRGIYIALGALTENVVQSAEYFGISSSVAINEDRIKIDFYEVGLSSVNDETLKNIKNRHSNKTIYLDKSLSSEAISALNEVEKNNIEVNFVNNKQKIKRIIQIHADAALYHAKNADFVRELTYWIRPNNTRAIDGMPGFVMGASLISSLVARTLLSLKPQLFQKAVNHDIELMKSASGLIVLGSSDNSPDGWVNAGRVIERCWLKLTELGLVAHPMTAITNNDFHAKLLISELKLQTYPLMVMRIGYSNRIDMRTPRRG